MTNPLREPLSEEQAHLIRVIYEPFDQSEEWPIWQYVDLTLDGRLGLDAADVLASLPRVGTPGQGSHGYGLTRYQNFSPMEGLDTHTGHPDPGRQIALTIAGLRYLPEAQPLVAAFLATIRHAVDQQRRLVPSPSRVVEAGVTAVDIEAQVLAA